MNVFTGNGLQLYQEMPLKAQQHIDDEASVGTTGYKLISSRLLSSDGHFKWTLLVAKLPLAAHQTAGELCREPTSWFVFLHPCSSGDPAKRTRLHLEELPLSRFMY